MTRSTYQADFWSYRAPAPERHPPAGLNVSQEQWERLSPGYRREISRQWQRAAAAKQGEKK